ncbi:MAG: hypothetical protein ACR2LN_03800 [Candidatus Levyibacteriota bacterium]
MRNRLLLTLSFFCLTATSFFVPTVMAADGQLSGKVIDSSGAPVTGSKLLVTNTATQKKSGQLSDRYKWELQTSNTTRSI